MFAFSSSSSAAARSLLRRVHLPFAVLPRGAASVSSRVVAVASPSSSSSFLSSLASLTVAALGLTLLGSARIRGDTEGGGLLRRAHAAPRRGVLEVADELYDQGKTQQLHSFLASSLAENSSNGAVHWRYARACHDLAALVCPSPSLPFDLDFEDAMNFFSALEIHAG